MKEENNILIYVSEEGEIELRADTKEDTIWATQEQISHLFEVSIPNVNIHLKNIFSSNELNENSVIKDFLITAKDGKKYNVKHYNLDVIIAIGYRVSSKKATQFRIWATRILRDYMTKGYNLNRHKLSKDTEALIGLYDAASMFEPENMPGKLKGKITFKLVKELEPRE